MLRILQMHTIIFKAQRERVEIVYNAFRWMCAYFVSSKDPTWNERNVNSIMSPTRPPTEENVMSQTKGINRWSGSVRRNGYLKPGSPNNVRLQAFHFGFGCESK